MCCFLMSSILPLLGICYLAWGSICIQDCTIPVLPVISKVLLLVFVQFAAAPIAFTVAQEETNDFSLRDFPIEFQKCHFIPGLFFSHQWEFLTSLFTQSPVAGVEIIEDTLLSLSLSLTWVWIRSSSLDSQGCLTYSKCFRWFKKCTCYLRDAKCNIHTKFFPVEMKPQVPQSAAFQLCALKQATVQLFNSHLRGWNIL